MPSVEVMETKKYKRGDERDDGRLFWEYQKTAPNGECWKTKEAFDKTIIKRRIAQRIRHGSTRECAESRDELPYIRGGMTARPKNESKVLNLLHARTSVAIGKQILGGKSSILKGIGCSLHELVCHLEDQFLEGMEWSNHGAGGWHIDHIKPISSFDLLDVDQRSAANNYTNLRPLWADDNFKKGSS